MSGYIGSRASVTVTSPETDSRYVNVTGDTMTGALLGTDLTLSGGVYLGGTGGENLLDDYEEGTFTPTLITVSGTPAYQYQEGYYTKVGRQVFGGGIIGITNSASLTGNIKIALPFALVSGSFSSAAGYAADGVGFSWPVTQGSSGNVYSLTFFGGSDPSLVFVSVSTQATGITYTASGIANSWYTRFGFSYRST